MPDGGLGFLRGTCYFFFGAAFLATAFLAGAFFTAFLATGAGATGFTTAAAFAFSSLTDRRAFSAAAPRMNASTATITISMIYFFFRVGVFLLTGTGFCTSAAFSVP